jgi:hypothetical protein
MVLQLQYYDGQLPENLEINRQGTHRHHQTVRDQKKEEKRRPLQMDQGMQGKGYFLVSPLHDKLS